MCRSVLGSLVLFVCVSAASAQPPLSPQDVQSELSRAERLYYEAQFTQSIQLLTPLDLALQDQSNRVQERIRVKLQLALAHVGSNEMSMAKTRFAEICSLDPGYDLNRLQFASKILGLFDEACSEQKQISCSSLCKEANGLLDTHNAEALLALIQSAPKNCSCLEGVAKDAAELFYKQGMEAYKQDDYARAQQRFKSAVALDPQHTLAAEYIELCQKKLQLTVDRLVLDWRKSFDAREFAQAGAVYRELMSPSLAENAAAALERIRAEYVKGVSSIAEAWKQNCSVNPLALPGDVIRQANATLPDPSIARDIIAQIGPCADPPPVQAQSCLQMTSQLALTRLKSRVNPEIPGFARPRQAVRLLLKLKINEEGNVIVNDVASPNRFLSDAVQAAVKQWKFFPALVANQPRCVETELPLVITP